MKKINYSFDPSNKESVVRKFLAHISIAVRSGQYAVFEKCIRFTNKSNAVDIGVTPNEELVDSNFFEKKYPFSKKLLAVSVEDCSILQKKYPKVKFKMIKPFSRFPFKDNEFDVVVSWATLEHAGTRNQQKLFLSECLRVGKQAFITTPNKRFIFDFHTNMFFAHWLPHKYFKIICNFFGKSFWGKINNLNLLTKRDIETITPKSGCKVLNYRTLGCLTTHFLIVKSLDFD